LSIYWKSICLVGLLGSLAMGPTARALADNENLVVTQDESSMERVIEQYLKDAHDLKCTEKFEDDDDLWLDYPITGTPMPAYTIAIDTQSVNTGKDGKVAERAVRLNVYTAVKVPDEKRAAVFEVFNDFVRKQCFCAPYVDTDGEIVLDWTLNVMAQGLPADYVHDAMVRLSNLWEHMWPPVSEALK
jgi:hypothetical protein